MMRARIGALAVSTQRSHLVETATRTSDFAMGLPRPMAIRPVGTAE